MSIQNRWLQIFWVALLFAGAAGATEPTPLQTLSPVQTGAPSVIRYFGQSQSVDGDRLAIGAPHNTGNGSGTAGTVYLFSRSGTSWNFLHTLQAPTPVAGDGFGYSVVLNGQTLLVGTPFGDNTKGVFHIYGFNGTTFVLQQTIAAPMDVVAGDWFGLRGAVDGGWLAVGAPSLSGAGAVYLYRYDALSENWVFHSKLVPNATSPFRFGFSLGLRGDQLLVGAFDYEANNEQGSVYAFSRTGNGSTAVWNLNQRFRMTSDAGANAAQLFGLSLSMNTAGTRVAVGAPLAGQLGGGSSVVGAVFVFERSGNTWTQTARLDSPLAARGNFGLSVHLVDDQLLAGDPRDATSGAIRGAAVLFKRKSSGEWFASQTWYRNTGSVGSNYGVSVSMAGTQYIVADSLADEVGATDRGLVFVHRQELLKDGFE